MPKQRITKEMVVDAAFEIARKDGIEKATVKTIAEKLGCSVQPIYSYCKIWTDWRMTLQKKQGPLFWRKSEKPLTETTCSAAPDTHIFRLQKMNLNIFRIVSVSGTKKCFLSWWHLLFGNQSECFKNNCRKSKYFHFCGKAAAPEYADLYHWYRNNLLRHLFLNFRSWNFQPAGAGLWSIFETSIGGQ